MRLHHFMTAALLLTTLPATTGEAQQRTMTRPDSARELPLCRTAERGERCRTRNGEVRIRGGARTNNLGGGDPGWEVRETEAQAEEFTGEETVFPATPQGERFGGEDPGWVRAPDGRLVRPVAPGGSPPEAEAMECEFCDDDEDIPQGPIDNTPGPEAPAPQEPEGEEEDCEWRNPSQGPDQDFCDE